jgi:hypothetical protein
MCVDDPSFEGTPEIGTLGGPGNLAPTAAPPGWQVCAGDPDINPSVTPLPASDGLTYIGLTLAPFTAATESEGTALCAPLEGGQTYSFSIDVATAGSVSSQLPPPGSTGSNSTPAALPVVLQIWGGRASCGKDELLWTSPEISKPGTWVRFCDALQPSQSLSYLRLVPAAGSSPFGPGQWSYLLVDHLVPGAVCH